MLARARARQGLEKNAAILFRLASSAANSRNLAATKQPKIPITTRQYFEHYRIVQEVGVVAGGDARSKNFIKDIVAALGGIFGGETTFYSHLINESSAAAVDKLVDHAHQLGAHGIVGMRFNHAATMNRLIVGLHELVLAYGTAVTLEPIDPAVDPFGIGKLPSSPPPAPPAGDTPSAPGDAPRNNTHADFQRLIRRSGAEER